MPAYRTLLGVGRPAPFVNVTFAWEGASRDVIGLLDTGADYTQIPEDIARVLRLRPTGHRRFTNADNRSSLSRIYVADVEVDGLRFPTLEVTGSQLPFCLVGRDIMSDLLAAFDGPAQSYSLRKPGES